MCTLASDSSRPAVDRLLLPHDCSRTGGCCECTLAASALAPEYRLLSAHKMKPLCSTAVPGCIRLVDAHQGFATVRILSPIPSCTIGGGRFGRHAINDGLALQFSGIETVLDCARLQPLDVDVDSELAIVVVHSASGLATRSTQLRQRHANSAHAAAHLAEEQGEQSPVKSTTSSPRHAPDTSDPDDWIEMDRGLIRYEHSFRWLMVPKLQLLQCVQIAVATRDPYCSPFYTARFIPPHRVLLGTPSLCLQSATSCWGVIQS